MNAKQKDPRGRKPKDPNAPEFDKLRELKNQVDADDAVAAASRDEFFKELERKFQEHGAPILADVVGLTAPAVQQALERRGVTSPRARS